MAFLTDFISQYGMVIVYAILTAVAGFLGAQVKKIYRCAAAHLSTTEDDTKRRVAETCVKAVEQLYKGLKAKRSGI